jgi:multidrug efflux system membrane fusion protein
MKNTLIIISLLLSGSYLFQSCTQESRAAELSKTEQPSPKAIPVKVIAVEATNAPIPIETSGMVKAQNNTKLGFKIGGVIETISANEGDWVKKGQVLARLAQTEIDAQVKQADIALKKAERDLERIENMFRDSVATLENVQDLTTARDVAEAMLEIAAFNREHALIRAPSGGKVLHKLAEAGEVCSPGTPILILNAEEHQPVIEVGITDREVVRIKIGDKARVHFDPFPGEAIPGWITDIAPQAEARTGLFTVEISLQKGDYPIRNGFFGQVELLPSQQYAYYPVPVSAIVEGDNQNISVFIPQGLGQVKKVQLQNYQIEADFIAVPVKGNPEIREVITDGATYLEDGNRIKVEGRR